MLTQTRLRALLKYNPETGVFTWVEQRHAHFAGTVAGSIHKGTGYCRITIDYKMYLAHRLAFLYMVGKFPLQVDHVNQNKADNRWSNLRECNSTQNAHNQPAKSTSKSGFKGVCKVGNKWQASIKVAGKSRHLGNFDTPEKAAQVYRDYAEKVQGTFAHPSLC